MKPVGSLAMRQGLSQCWCSQEVQTGPTHPSPHHCNKNAFTGTRSLFLLTHGNTFPQNDHSWLQQDWALKDLEDWKNQASGKIWWLSAGLAERIGLPRAVYSLRLLFLYKLLQKGTKHLGNLTSSTKGQDSNIQLHGWQTLCSLEDILFITIKIKEIIIILNYNY